MNISKLNVFQNEKVTEPGVVGVQVPIIYGISLHFHWPPLSYINFSLAVVGGRQPLSKYLEGY